MGQSTVEKENKMLEDAISRNATEMNDVSSEISQLKSEILFLESPAFASVKREFDENLRITQQNIGSIINAFVPHPE
jgi:hypothetical protein